ATERLADIRCPFVCCLTASSQRIGHLIVPTGSRRAGRFDPQFLFHREALPANADLADEREAAARYAHCAEAAGASLAGLFSTPQFAPDVEPVAGADVQIFLPTSG